MGGSRISSGNVYTHSLIFAASEIQIMCSRMRPFNYLGEGIFTLVGCSGDLVPVGIKVRAKTQPNPSGMS